ncbi:hypothetical protein [Desulfosporosinus sp. OT]|nr:hypothetical protein [Desulfosporosinus sp. OT]
MIKFLTQHMSPILVAAIRMPLAGIVLLFFVFKKYGCTIPVRNNGDCFFV